MKKELSCLAALAVFLGWGCTEEDGAMRCLPGAVSTCPCVGGGAGVQTCLPSGLGLGPCECGVEPDVVSDTSTDTSTDDAPDTDDTGEHDLEGDTAGPDETDSGDGTTTPDTTATCPTAVIRVAEGDEVEPQTTLHLDGGDSIGSVNGAVTAWVWSVVQPSGSVSTFSPSAYVRNPTFGVNVVGTYTFRLEVFDAAGTKSCEVAEYTVTMTVNDAVRVELTWETPNAPDTGTPGTDLDLHFLHPNANGAYFDRTYDCYWENVHPEWGLFGPIDNPWHSGDGFPESVTISTPQQGMRFQVGTHHRDDHEVGPAIATLSVYIYGVLRDRWSNVELDEGDMWDSHYIDWPSGTVTRITAEGGGPRITPQYEASPDFPF